MKIAYENTGVFYTRILLDADTAHRLGTEEYIEDLIGYTLDGMSVVGDVYTTEGRRCCRACT